MEGQVHTVLSEHLCTDSFWKYLLASKYDILELLRRLCVHQPDYICLKLRPITGVSDATKQTKKLQANLTHYLLW